MLSSLYQWRNEMKRIALAAGLAVALAGSAFAQTTTTTTTTSVVVGDGMFKTRTEAESGMKTIKVCSTN